MSLRPGLHAVNWAQSMRVRVSREGQDVGESSVERNNRGFLLA